MNDDAVVIGYGRFGGRRSATRSKRSMKVEVEYETRIRLSPCRFLYFPDTVFFSQEASEKRVIMADGRA